MSEKNPAIIWSRALVGSLAQSGLTAVCVAPGSRSTPLAFAFAAHPGIHVYRHLDERSAGYVALGLALSSDRPVALLCTSGTATANFLPAIVEAHMSQVPLLLLTADRPPELRHSGANQTIDQVKLYGDQVLWSVDMGLPVAGEPPVALRNVVAVAARAFARANGTPKGVVHLNLPFRKPLEPTTPVDDSTASAFPAPRMSRGMLMPSDEQIVELAEIIAAHRRGLIVAGPRSPEAPFPQAVAALSEKAGYPIVADPLSNLRFGLSAHVVGGHETLMSGGRQPAWEEPEIIIRFGAVPTSKWLNQYLDQIKPRHRVHVRSNGVWADDAHRTTRFLQVDETALCRAIAGRLSVAPDQRWADSVIQVDQRLWNQLEHHLAQADFDAAYVSDLFQILPDQTTVLVGNSLPIRHVDQFARPSSRMLRLFGNRGASGIDGNLSTALGLAAAGRRPLVALVGDITFYHDASALMAASQIDAPVTVVLFNNGGGGIFRRLPVHAFDPPFTDLFLTPHQTSFADLAAAYQVRYQLAPDRATFRRFLSQAVARPQLDIIEVRTDSGRDESARQQLVKELLPAISG